MTVPRFDSDRAGMLLVEQPQNTPMEIALARAVVRHRCGQDAEDVLRALGLAEYPRHMWRRSRG
jgi:hypothetical protein